MSTHPLPLDKGSGQTTPAEFGQKSKQSKSEGSDGGGRSAKLARDLMTPDPACCRPHTSVDEIAQLMREHDCGEIPVIDADDHPIGVVTDRDIVVRVVAERRNPIGYTAENCMTTTVVTVRVQDSLADVLQTMEKHQIRRVPVVDDEGRCAGIISQADIARDASPRDVAELVREVSST
jgi:CBS domain-containing protein